MRSSILLFADTGLETTEPEGEQLQKKEPRKHRRIPVITFILLLVTIVMVLMVLEYFI
jgi:predicted nucleic acid-binding Zn ribbon protein